MIEEPSYPPNAPITPTNEEQPERYRFRPRQPYVCNPNKLFENNSTEQVKQTTSTGAMLPPKEFLKDLQRVMTKKWQVAEKCRESTQPNIRNGPSSSTAKLSPHQVLGFRDPVDILGAGHNYSRDENVGAWILQTQQYTDRQLQRTEKPEPLYAISSKHHEEQPYAQNNQMFNPSHFKTNPSQNSRATLEQQYTPNRNSQQGSQLTNPVMSPVVLREPTPDLDPYAVSNYSKYSYSHQNNGHINGQMQGPPPPPSLRSPNQHTYDQNGSYQLYETIGNQNLIPNGHFMNGDQKPRPMTNNLGQYPNNVSNYPPHASSIGHITANSFNVGGCAYASHKKSSDKPPPPPPKRSETTQLSTQ
jgi:hypothetical protein